MTKQDKVFITEQLKLQTINFDKKLDNLSGTFDKKLDERDKTMYAYFDLQQEKFHDYFVVLREYIDGKIENVYSRVDKTDDKVNKIDIRMTNLETSQAHG